MSSEKTSLVQQLQELGRSIAWLQELGDIGALTEHGDTEIIGAAVDLILLQAAELERISKIMYKCYNCDDTPYRGLCATCADELRAKVERIESGAFDQEDKEDWFDAITPEEDGLV